MKRNEMVGDKSLATHAAQRPHNGTLLYGNGWLTVTPSGLFWLDKSSEKTRTNDRFKTARQTIPKCKRHPAESFTFSVVGKSLSNERLNNNNAALTGRHAQKRPVLQTPDDRVCRPQRTEITVTHERHTQNLAQHSNKHTEKYGSQTIISATRLPAQTEEVAT